MTAPIGTPESFGALLPGSRPDATAAPSPRGVAAGKSFAEQVEQLVTGSSELQRTAQEKSTEFAQGGTDDLHDTMIAVEQAEISLRLLANVRNRVVDMYREVMRMGS